MPSPRPFRGMVMGRSVRACNPAEAEERTAMTNGDKLDGGGHAARRNAVDVQVGERLRERRMLLGLSQEKLAASIGLTFQQIQKYERGANRIGAGRLYDLSRRLDVPIGYFFAGLGPEKPVHADRSAQIDPPPQHRRESADLIRAYYRIEDPKMRACMVELCRAMARAARPSRSPDGLVLT